LESFAIRITAWRASLILVLIVSLLTACAQGRSLRPAPGQEGVAHDAGSAVATAAGIRLVVRTGAWDGNPSDGPDDVCGKLIEYPHPLVGPSARHDHHQGQRDDCQQLARARAHLHRTASPHRRSTAGELLRIWAVNDDSTRGLSSRQRTTRARTELRGPLAELADLSARVPCRWRKSRPTVFCLLPPAHAAGTIRGAVHSVSMHVSPTGIRVRAHRTPRAIARAKCWPPPRTHLFVYAT
jgi:hypothetical protein